MLVEFWVYLVKMLILCDLLKFIFGLILKLRAIKTFQFFSINVRSFSSLSAKFGRQIVQHVTQYLK